VDTSVFEPFLARPFRVLSESSFPSGSLLLSHVLYPSQGEEGSEVLLELLSPSAEGEPPAPLRRLAARRTRCT
jgi:hypothetical protein